jgi:hypothetical protein
MKHLSRLLLGLAVVLGVYASHAVVATFSQLADAADRLYAGAGAPIFWGLAAAFTLLVAWPLVLLMRLPRMKPPPPDTAEPACKRHQSRLKQHLSRRPYLQVQTLALKGDVSGARAVLDLRANELVRDRQRRVCEHRADTDRSIGRPGDAGNAAQAHLATRRVV